LGLCQDVRLSRSAKPAHVMKWPLKLRLVRRPECKIARRHTTRTSFRLKHTEGLFWADIRPSLKALYHNRHSLPRPLTTPARKQPLGHDAFIWSTSFTEATISFWRFFWRSLLVLLSEWNCASFATIPLVGGLCGGAELGLVRVAWACMQMRL